MDDFFSIHKQVKRLLRKKHLLLYPLSSALFLIDNLGLNFLIWLELIIDLGEYFQFAITDERIDTQRTTSYMSCAACRTSAAANNKSDRGAALPKPGQVPGTCLTRYLPSLN